MSDLIFWTKNQLWESGVVLKNGTGGGAPALVEDADWPMSNLLKKGRYLYWKADMGSLVPVHFDLGASKTLRAAALVMNRGYSTDPFDPFYGDITTCNVYYDNGSTYPPAGWTSIGNLTPVGNNTILDFLSGIAGRFWRFDVSASIVPSSCKLWLIPDANRVALGNEYSPETTDRERKLKLSSRTMAGLPEYYDPVDNFRVLPHSRYLRPDLVWRQVPEADRAIIEALGALDYPFLCNYPDGSVREFALEGGVVKWTKVFGPPALFNVETSMIELV
jgi:hypothetical protein